MAGGYGVGGSSVSRLARLRRRALLHIVPPADPQKQPDITPDALRVLPCPCPRCGARMIVIEVFARGCKPSWRPMPSTVDTS